MMTVNEVSKLTGVSIRTLQYYDTIGLLKPDGYSAAGYRLYDDAALARLQEILLFRELEFPLKAIRSIMLSPDHDREKALQQQIEMLSLKKEHLEALIDYARGLLTKGENTMSFDAFDTKKLDDYAKKAREQWGGTEAYREFEKKSGGRTREEEMGLGSDLMQIFAEFGSMKDQDPAADAPQQEAAKLQAFITAHYYTCTKEILCGLGAMYAAGGEFTENIDKAGGAGTAAFAAKAIALYCGK